MSQENLHPATQELLGHFEYGHLPQYLQTVSMYFRDTAETMVTNLGEGPETSAGLRKLLEAKDCFVRQAVKKMKEHDAQ
ncbi:hypothetical protein SEA_JUMBO_31 [Gordonia phage Jumbo]|uniref:Uncharacterized protein n=1 Tax=Gordonia phage Jumbo TaxID=1887650 RepID=A0A1B3B0L8_9CAUD|nr:hypothetical protein BIZ69_gp031 [Gordonia phage Jumbo]AOE44542.1 hypothetical protein SEA_JUMBO_31 [Gordonia phage Jumbo]